MVSCGYIAGGVIIKKPGRWTGLQTVDKVGMEHAFHTRFSLVFAMLPYIGVKPEY